MVSYDKAYFNGKGYIKYEDFPSHYVRALHLVSLFRPESVLDVGCAYGYVVKYLHDFGIRAVGCDVSEYAGERSKEVIPSDFVLCDMRQGLPFADKSFDLLYCEGVLEHIEEKYLDFIMKEFERVSNKRCLQIALSEHPNAELEQGHITLKDHLWWYEKMPMRTCLALESSIDTNTAWLMKG